MQALLAKTVEMLDKIPMEDRDTKGDLYEYMLGKIATAGQNGQFRTPRHIIQLMVEMTEPTPDGHDLRSGRRHLRLSGRRRGISAQAPPWALRDEKLSNTSMTQMFHGFDFDPTMLRIGWMNMPLHGVENPTFAIRTRLSHDHAAKKGRTPWSWPIPHLPGRSTTRHRQGPASDRQDQEDRIAVPGSLLSTS